ncbi:FMN-binding negative transcriptional regulator [Paenibacillus sp. PR3]|uniref:FMN-binding negative transcriptional regulator n=1 Tax=Paenibacillus terricola TaxID=2763503 RepID=A0ABR8N3C9_9BACL|nr:FMN-binding negative transcriptional regulator [Paenibacillus terricola]MBD3921720.1 FMN-binding negative transcriptional regulator [Paenibacillus terricola]
MYIPKAFEVDDKTKIVNFIKDNSFGILFSHHKNNPFATHLPFLIDEKKYDKGVLISHMARANPHWRDLDNKEVLVVFSGPHAYISPSWYEEPRIAPTWNYVAVHAYGEFKVIDDRDEVEKIISNTVNFFESPLPNPWLVSFDDKFIDGLMNGLVAFEIKLNRLEGKWKLSQNHSIQRQQNLVKGLASSDKYHSLEIAKLIEENILKVEEKPN